MYILTGIASTACKAYPFEDLRKNWGSYSLLRFQVRQAI